MISDTPAPPSSATATFLPGPLHSPTLGTSFPEACKAGKRVRERRVRIEVAIILWKGKGCC